MAWAARPSATAAVFAVSPIGWRRWAGSSMCPASQEAARCSGRRSLCEALHGGGERLVAVRSGRREAGEHPRPLVRGLVLRELELGVPVGGDQAERDDLVGHLAGGVAHVVQRPGVLHSSLEMVDVA